MEKQKLLLGKIQSVADLGNIVRKRRKQMGITQLDLSGITGVGNRFIVDLENGKETIQLGKALSIISWVGIELVAVEK
ncbi:MAG: type II toxin-antitoxin system Y4mF family antitoxin [Alphaproteobacteria bacterium]|uniref:Type II toxin-antitoxin system Y4mF family antitoxin n=1 Tax=Candidatus Nitrobium versatile TaxID=2884831 RepID=A0A953SI84_9BACT|nr:type II toxin-antitoxin system Y4mF family antitoxin [Candidatus Nitrobium versatile]